MKDLLVVIAQGLVEDPAAVRVDEDEPWRTERSVPSPCCRKRHGAGYRQTGSHCKRRFVLSCVPRRPGLMGKFRSKLIEFASTKGRTETSALFLETEVKGAFDMLKPFFRGWAHRQHTRRARRAELNLGVIRRRFIRFQNLVLAGGAHTGSGRGCPAPQKPAA